MLGFFFYPQSICDCEPQNMSVSAVRWVHLININGMYSIKLTYLIQFFNIHNMINIVTYLDYIVGHYDLSLELR